MNLSECEIVCAGMKESLKEFPRDMCILLDPNIWIFDTGTTVHTSPHKQGMVKVSESSDQDNITAMNGMEEKLSMIGEFQACCVTRMATRLRKEHWTR